MTRITITFLIALIVVSIIWFYNATVLTDRRIKQTDELYDKLFNMPNKTDSDMAKIHLEIEHITELDVWSWQMCSGLWVFTLIALIIYLLFGR